MTETRTHTSTIVTFCNGGAKARRYRCSCGSLGVRFAYGPLAGGRSLAAATAKAEADHAAHAAP